MFLWEAVREGAARILWLRSFWASLECSSARCNVIVCLEYKWLLWVCSCCSCWRLPGVPDMAAMTQLAINTSTQLLVPFWCARIRRSDTAVHHCFKVHSVYDAKAKHSATDRGNAHGRVLSIRCVLQSMARRQKDFTTNWGDVSTCVYTWLPMWNQICETRFSDCMQQRKQKCVWLSLCFLWFIHFVFSPWHLEFKLQYYAIL